MKRYKNEFCFVKSFMPFTAFDQTGIAGFLHQSVSETLFLRSTLPALYPEEPGSQK